MKWKRTGSLDMLPMMQLIISLTPIASVRPFLPRPAAPTASQISEPTVEGCILSTAASARLVRSPVAQGPCDAGSVPDRCGLSAAEIHRPRGGRRCV